MLNNFIDTLPPAYRWPVQLCIVSTATTYILSVITANVSQVDRLWTFLPTIYTAYFALLPLWPNEQPFFLCPYSPKDLGWTVATDFSPRALLMFGLVFIWMCRLSYNTYRRGLFSLTDEDYRWAVLRKQLSPFLFQVTNLTFIAATQNVLLLLLGLPTMSASTLQPHTGLALSDIALGSLALAVLALEFTSDNQQYSFQTYKHAFLASEKGKSKVEPYDVMKQWPGSRLNWTPEDARRGFVTKGLWAYVRHPNFACEQSFWWIITLMPLLSPFPPCQLSFSFYFSRLPSLSELIKNFPKALYPVLEENKPALELLIHTLPALALTALFFSSTIYTEAITQGKYDAYKAYQERVGMFKFMTTWQKGLQLAWRGRKEEVEAAVWGSGERGVRKSE